MVDIAMNRAVHLARRDAHYNYFKKLLEKGIGVTSLSRRRERINALLLHIREAYNECLYAMRGIKPARAEKSFLKFLDLVHDAARASGVMIQHEALLKEDESFLNKFLEKGKEQLLRSEERYRGMEADIVAGMMEIIVLAERAYRRLRDKNSASLSREERERYEAAYNAVIR